MFVKILAIVCVAGLLISCGSIEPCSVQAVDYLFEVDRIECDYWDIMESTSEQFLLLEAKEKALDEARSLSPPVCAQNLHVSLIERYETEVAYMNAYHIGIREKELNELARVAEDAGNAYLEKRNKLEPGMRPVIFDEICQDR